MEQVQNTSWDKQSDGGNDPVEAVGRQGGYDVTTGKKKKSSAFVIHRLHSLVLSGCCNLSFDEIRIVCTNKVLCKH